MKEITEYKKTQLPQTVTEFVDSYNGGPVPDLIKNELVKYLSTIEPEVIKAQARLNELMNKAFTK